jgi:hypothetical protein
MNRINKITSLYEGQRQNIDNVRRLCRAETRRRKDKYGNESIEDHNRRVLGEMRRKRQARLARQNIERNLFRTEVALGVYTKDGPLYEPEVESKWTEIGTTDDGSAVNVNVNVSEVAVIDYESWTVPELRKVAAERNIKGRSKMTKPQLIEALS